MAATVTHPNRLVIPEIEFDPDHLIDLLKSDKIKNPSRYNLLIMAEGARMKGSSFIIDKELDGFGHPKLGGIGTAFSKYWEKKTNRSAGVLHLTYQLRSGAPTASDKILAQNYSKNAIECIKKGDSGFLMTINEGKFDKVDFKYVNSHQKRLNPEFYDDEEYKVRHKMTIGKSAIDNIAITTKKAA